MRVVIVVCTKGEERGRWKERGGRGRGEKREKEKRRERERERERVGDESVSEETVFMLDFDFRR